MLVLKQVNQSDIMKEWLFVRDMPVDENGLTNSYSGITWEDFQANAAAPPQGQPPGYTQPYDAIPPAGNREAGGFLLP